MLLSFISILLLAGLFGPQETRSDQVPEVTEVIGAGSARPLGELLPDALGGVRAAGDVSEYAQGNLGQVPSVNAALYEEYRVSAAASRLYGRARVDVFQTENMVSAYGLFTAVSALVGGEPLPKPVGFDSAGADGVVVFWKGHYFVRVIDARPKASGTKPGAFVSLAAALADLVGPPNAIPVRPSLLESLPRDPVAPDRQWYLLGPESLGALVEGGRQMFDFAGRAEAVLAEYPAQAGGSATRLLIVEYHTPAFALDAWVAVSDFLSSLPEDRASKTITKREGNYIVMAMGFDDRQVAEQLVDSVKYPYTVKWLRNPLWPTTDPFRSQKAAQLLISTFAILGLIILTVLTIGSAFGAAVFLKRRKRQREIFSDAGGMLRLDLDLFEATILGLPPARSNDE
jgi:hypothetical protein